MIYSELTPNLKSRKFLKAPNATFSKVDLSKSLSNTSKEKVVPLPVAGIMSDKDGHTIGNQYAELDKMAKELGCTLNAPYMTLSFMALLVIPSLKLSDKGLFDGTKFEFTSLEV